MMLMVQRASRKPNQKRRPVGNRPTQHPLRRINLSPIQEDLVLHVSFIFFSFSTPFKIKPEVIKLVSCSTQLWMKFIMPINVKMPTIVGILTFISMINTTSEGLKAKKSNFYHFSFYELLKFHAQLSRAWRNLGSIQDLVSHVSFSF